MYTFSWPVVFPPGQARRKTLSQNCARSFSYEIFHADLLRAAETQRQYISSCVISVLLLCRIRAEIPATHGQKITSLVHSNAWAYSTNVPPAR